MAWNSPSLTLLLAAAKSVHATMTRSLQTTLHSAPSRPATIRWRATSTQAEAASMRRSAFCPMDAPILRLATTSILPCATTVHVSCLTVVRIHSPLTSMPRLCAMTAHATTLYPDAPTPPLATTAQAQIKTMAHAPSLSPTLTVMATA